MRNAPIEEEEEYLRRCIAATRARELAGAAHAECALARQLMEYAQALCEEFVVVSDEADVDDEDDDCPVT